jgi:phosphinothricin acetyltransferase
MAERDRESVVYIFNYYVGHGFAAYPEHTLPYDFFDHLLVLIDEYPSVVARDAGGKIIGFGFLHAHHPLPTFGRAAEITYFILPEHTRQGIGRRILEGLVQEAPRLGVDAILASISSLNEQSISFHRRVGFEQCGRFRQIGKKSGQDFDVIWMQKLL